MASIEYPVTIKYNRSGRSDSDSYTKTVGIATPWDIVNTMGNDVRGGEVVLSYNVGGCSGQISFHIRGTNPDDAVVEARIGANPWFAKYIAKTESKQAGAPAGNQYYNQFNEIGVENQGANDVKFTPNANGQPVGFGIFQLTNFDTPARPPTKQEIWSWKANVDAGVAWVNYNLQQANNWMNAAIGSPGYPNGGQRVQAATDTGAAVPVPDETSANVTFSDGTARVIEHAVAMKMWNGASGGNYCSWDNANQVWKFNRLNVPPAPLQPFDYVKRVCTEVPPP